MRIVVLAGVYLVLCFGAAWVVHPPLPPGEELPSRPSPPSVSVSVSTDRPSPVEEVQQVSTADLEPSKADWVGTWDCQAQVLTMRIEEDSQGLLVSELNMGEKQVFTQESPSVYVFEDSRLRWQGHKTLTWEGPEGESVEFHLRSSVE